MFWVYVLYSEKVDRYYCGQTNDIDLRLQRHNEGLVMSTRGKGPWILITKFSCDSRSEALALEQKIKKRGIKRFLQDIGFV